MPTTRVLILGAGPAGLGAAYRLRRDRLASVTVVERGSMVGGNAGSFFSGGQYLDYGSHRLHPSCDPQILTDIRRLLSGSLLKRERRGRIRLRGRWLRFPLQPLDLTIHSEKSFALSVLKDMVSPRRRSPSTESFATALEARLGATICRDFYFPYARKIWGREPEELSPILAQKRVSADSFLKLARRIVGKRGGFFFYPERGYGAISEAYAEAARELGADVLLGWTAIRLRHGGESGGWHVEVARGEERREIGAEFVWSTIPITAAARLVDPSAPSRVLDAAASIGFRGMLLVYLRLNVDHFTPFDAHYFPQSDIRISRLSEPKNYSGSKQPEGQTTICAELPCEADGDLWCASSASLEKLVSDDLARAGLALPVTPSAVLVRRLRQAYPIYSLGYQSHLDTIDNWLAALPNFISYGRQGLFAHDNTHHALYMAYAAAECLAGDGFDVERWKEYLDEFTNHVVED